VVQGYLSSICDGFRVFWENLNLAARWRIKPETTSPLDSSTSIFLKLLHWHFLSIAIHSKAINTSCVLNLSHGIPVELASQAMDAIRNVLTDPEQTIALLETIFPPWKLSSMASINSRWRWIIYARITCVTFCTEHVTQCVTIRQIQLLTRTVARKVYVIRPSSPSRLWTGGLLKEDLAHLFLSMPSLFKIWLLTCHINI
jgi:hypothetical protein